MAYFIYLYKCVFKDPIVQMTLEVPGLEQS